MAFRKAKEDLPPIIKAKVDQIGALEERLFLYQTAQEWVKSGVDDFDALGCGVF